MAGARVERRLAAILAADVVGYSRLMGLDEEGTLAALKSCRRELLDPKIAEYRGRIFKTTGDGALVEFASAVDATCCAIDIQGAMAERNAAIPAERRVQFRIGINVGDIIIDEDDIYGDGVNIAARIESIAEPGGVSLSEDVWRQVQGKVPAELVDSGEHTLKNIARPVRVFRVTRGEEAAVKPAAAVTAHPEKPSVAVLPFQNMSGDPEQEHFCDGLVEDIITTLSKLSDLRVIARNSSFVYKGRSVDIRDVAKQLGVRYVLEGSVRKSGSRIRITAQLIDAKDGAHVWAERYDRSIEDIFAIQDEITLVLATEMQVKLTDGEQARLHYTTTHNVEAWTSWVQGLFYFRQAVTSENVNGMRLHWEKALGFDPKSAPLNAMLGFVHFVDARFGWRGDVETNVSKAHAYAERALEIDPNNADAYVTSAFVSVYRRQYEEAAAAARKAIQLAPGSADTASLAAWALTLAGHPAEAAVQAEKCMSLSPNFPAVYLGTLGDAYRLSGRTREAIAAFEGYHARSPGFGLTDMVIAYQELGQPDDAKRTAERLLAARPNFTIAGWLKTQSMRRDRARVDADAAALRATGLPEG